MANDYIDINKLDLEELEKATGGFEIGGILDNTGEVWSGEAPGVIKTEGLKSRDEMCEKYGTNDFQEAWHHMTQEEQIRVLEDAVRRNLR